MDSTGAWKQLTVPEGQIAVLAGYTLERATCGLITAAKHRMVCFNASMKWLKCTLTPHYSIGTVQHKAFHCPFSRSIKPQQHFSIDARNMLDTITLPLAASSADCAMQPDYTVMYPHHFLCAMCVKVVDIMHQ